MPRPTRRQLTLFLPPAQQAIVEPIRQRLDPRQHALVPAHVTLCRDDELPSLDVVDRRLADLGAFAFTMRFSGPQRLADGAILLRPTLGTDSYQRVRQSILGSSAKVHGAHITLLHPRHATDSTFDLSEIAPLLTGLTATFRIISLIEQCGQGPWRVRQEYGALT